MAPLPAALAPGFTVVSYECRGRGESTDTLVIDSEGSDDRLRSWARGVAGALPDGVHRSLPGEWHVPSTEDLAGALTEFLSRP
jgi:hypothetical protein